MTRKQLFKGLWAASFVAVLAVLSVPAEAAQITCRIPFGFTINDQTLPAGIYSVSTEVVRGALFVRGVSHGAAALTVRVESRRDTQPKLVFHKYGDEYFLRQAWMGGGEGRQLSLLRRERELIKTARSGRIAANVERVLIPGL